VSHRARPREVDRTGQATLEYVGLLVLIVVALGIASYRNHLLGAGRAVVGVIGKRFLSSGDDDAVRLTRSELEASLAGVGLSLPLAIQRAEAALGPKAAPLIREELVDRMPGAARELLRGSGATVDPGTGKATTVVREGLGFHVVTSGDETRGRGLYQPEVHLDELGAFVIDAGVDVVAGKAGEAAASVAGEAIGKMAGGGLLGSWGSAARLRKAAPAAAGGAASNVAGRLVEGIRTGGPTDGDIAARALAAFAASSNEDLPPIGAQAGDVIVCTTERTLHVRVDRVLRGPGRVIAAGYRPGVAAYTTGRLSDPSVCRPD